MSLRVDSSSLIAGALVCGNRGLGVLGSEVPASGDNGPGYLYNDLSLPADAGKEVRGLIVTPPAAGTFLAYEDSSFEFYGADPGAYSFTYRLFVDGADLGTADVELRVGTVTHEASGAIAAGGAVISGAALREDGGPAPVTHETSGAISGAGAQVVGSAMNYGAVSLTPADIAAIADAVWNHPKALTFARFLATK